MTDGKTPDLLDPQSRGGLVAEGGFQFQNELIIARVPFWLSRDAFSELMREGLADAEARFFSMDRNTTFEIIEYKNHNMAPAEFWDEIGRFYELDRGHEGAYFRFTLTCPSVSPALEPVLNALRRVRDALPFYNGQASIQDSSYSAFLDVVQAQGKSKDLARFMFWNVFVDSSPPKTVEQNFERFRGALERYFPVFEDLGSKCARTAYEKIGSLVSAKSGTPVRREELEEALWAAAPEYRPAPPAIRLFTLHELPAAPVWDIPPDIRIDWTQFTGGATREFPPTSEWTDAVIAPLQRLREWIIQTNRVRRVALRGQRRLSAAIACGSTFNAVAGFEIDLHSKADEIWSTDDYPPVEAEYPWQVRFLNNDEGDEIAVSIGILRNPVDSVSAYLEETAMNLPIVSLHSDHPILSAQHTNIAVRRAKDLIAEAVARMRPHKVHLFYAGPSQFAIFLEHRLNTLGVVQCYEWSGGSSYVPSCLLNHS